MKYSSWILASFIFLAAAPAAVADTPAFHDDFQIKTNLHQQGINTTTLNWVEIESICMDLRRQGNNTGFLGCQYQKAIDQALYTKDKNQCTTRAEAAGLPQTGLETITETDAKGIKHTYQRTIVSIGEEDKKKLRDAAYIDCMQKLGWADVNDWKMGQRNQFCAK